MKKVILAIGLVLTVPGCFAQLAKDIEQLKTIDVYRQEQKPKYSVPQNNSTLYLVAKQFFVFYKHFVSSQDANVCPYSPSCSVYMMHSIEKKGVLAGVLNGFDRWTRCNGRDLEKYFMDHSIHKLIDPPDYKKIK